MLCLAFRDRLTGAFVRYGLIVSQHAGDCQVSGWAGSVLRVCCRRFGSLYPKDGTPGCTHDLRKAHSNRLPVW
jgi:hypothetical protein